MQGAVTLAKTGKNVVTTELETIWDALIPRR